MASTVLETTCACGAEMGADEDLQFFSIGDGAVQCEDCLDAEGGE